MGTCMGRPSSRKIEKATYELHANTQNPRDHASIADFRQQHLAELAKLFVQVLRLCEHAATEPPIGMRDDNGRKPLLSWTVISSRCKRTRRRARDRHPKWHYLAGVRAPWV